MSTFYATTGAAQGTGDGSSEANRIELKKAIENDAGLHTALAAGDTIYCKDDGELVYDGSAGVFATAALVGTADAPIRVIGYSATEEDGGIIDLRDSNAGATNDCFASNKAYWNFENIRVTDGRDAFDSGTTNGLFFRNCHAVNCLTVGFMGPAGTGDSPTFQGCTAVGCGNRGYSVSARGPRFIDCVAKGNGSDGFGVGNASQGAILVRCLAHANGADGFVCIGEATLVDCLSDGNTSDGYLMDGGHGHNTLVNCGATNNGAFGVEGDSGAIVNAINCGLNPTNNANTSGKSQNVVLREVGAVAGDPLFADRANDDFTPQTGSAWLNAGTELGGGA